MKRRRSVFVTFVVLALLCLGFGYAALTDQLQIKDGTVTGGEDIVVESQFDIQFGDVNATVTKPVSESLVSATAEAASGNNTTASLTITNMCVKDEVATATYAVKNMEITNGYQALVSAVMTIEKVSGIDSAINVKIYWEGEEGNAQTADITSSSAELTVPDTTIDQNASKNLIIKVTMKKTLVGSEAISYTVNVDIDAKAQ